MTTRRPVLIYHPIADGGPAGPARRRVSPGMFDTHLGILQRHGYHKFASPNLLTLRIPHSESARKPA